MTRHNLTFAIRSLRRSPAYSVTVIASLALGIGAAVGMFAIIHAVLLRNLPFPEPDRLVRVIGIDPQVPQEIGQYALDPHQFHRWRSGTRSLSALAACQPATGVLTDQDTPVPVDGLLVTPEFFDTLGVRPLLGSWFTAEDEVPGRATRIILQYETWRQRFNSDRAIVGKKVYFDGAAIEVAGVAPENMWLPTGQQLHSEFVIADRISFFLPLRIPVQSRGLMSFYPGFARLAPGVSAQEAAAELNASMASIIYSPAIVHPARVHVQPLHGVLVRDSRSSLLLLQAAVLSLLLIVCLNIANLSLVRWTRKAQELAVRMALGASQWQLTALCLTESGLLAAVGLTGGILFADVLVQAVRQRADVSIPLLESAQIDAEVILFALAIGIAVALVVGLLPAWRLSRSVIALQTMSASRGQTSDRRSLQTQSLLVALQVALAVVLLNGCVLFTLSLRRVMQVEPSYAASGVSVVRLAMPKNRYPGTKERVQVTQRLLAELVSTAGVSQAGAVTSPPTEESWNFAGIHVRETAHKQAGECGASECPLGSFLGASRSYFETMAIPLLAGRLFADNETGVAVISHTAARTLFPNRNPIGEEVIHAYGREKYRVIGVVGDVYGAGLDQAPSLTVYRSLQHGGWWWVSPSIHLMVRSSQHSSALYPSVQNAIRRVDPAFAASSIQALADVTRPEVQRRRLQAELISGFGVIALVVAAAGIYAVVAFSLAQRRRELAIRMALGAGGPEIEGLVWRQARTPVLWGLAIGLLAALALGWVTRSLLFEVSPVDPGILLLTVVVVTGAAAVPCRLLAKRATRLQPALVMQME